MNYAGSCLTKPFLQPHDWQRVKPSQNNTRQTQYIQKRAKEMTIKLLQKVHTKKIIIFTPLFCSQAAALTVQKSESLFQGSSFHRLIFPNPLLTLHGHSQVKFKKDGLFYSENKWNLTVSLESTWSITQTISSKPLSINPVNTGAMVHLERWGCACLACENFPAIWQPLGL